MTTISIDSNIYKGAEIYARKNNISIRELVENSLKKFIVSEKKETNIRSVNELHPSVQALIGIGRIPGGKAIEDINARDIKEYTCNDTIRVFNT